DDGCYNPLQPAVLTPNASLLTARGTTGASLATSANRSTAEREHIAPMVRSPPDPTLMRERSGGTLRKLTSLTGRTWPAFIINISAVPLAIAIASDSERGSSSSKGVMPLSLLRLHRMQRAGHQQRCRQRASWRALWIAERRSPRRRK